MLEWKILAAAFSALLVISMLLVGNSGVKDMFGGIVGKLTDWLGGAPMPIPSGKPGSKEIALSLYPKNFTLSPGSKLNLTLGESYFEDFNGDISVDYTTGRLSLKEKGSSLSISSAIQPLEIQNLGIPRLQMAEMKFILVSSQSNITSESGPIDIQNFQGTFSISNSSITLEGNVTKITGDGWSVG